MVKQFRLTPIAGIACSAVVAVLFALPFALASRRVEDRRQRANTDLLALLDKARDTTNLFHSGAHFRLKGRLKAFTHKSAVQGDLLLDWDSAAQWRQEVRWSDGTSVVISNNDRRWKSNVEAHRLDLYLLNKALRTGQWLWLAPNEEVEKKKKDKIEGTSADCYEIGSSVIRERTPIQPYSWREICLDAESSLPLREQLFQSGQNIVYSSYTPLGLLRFPTRLRYLWTSKPLLELSVDSLEELGQDQHADLTPPAGAVAHPWCPGMAAPVFAAMQSRLINGIPDFKATSKFNQKGLAVVGVTIDKQGRPRDIQVLMREGVDDLLAAQLDLLKNETFHPAVCGDTPVDYESELEMYNRWRMFRF